MTDLRYMENHKEKDPGGWLDVLIGILAMAVFLFVLSVLWNVLPGCRTIDDVMQIETTTDHYYHPTTHQMTFVGKEDGK